MNDYNFLNAHFINNERKVVRVYWADPSSSEIIETVVEVNETDHEWKKLLEHITSTQLHDNTYKYIQDSQSVIKEHVASIAKENGWIYDIDNSNHRAAVKALFETVFKPFDEVNDKENLFFMKLEVFELDFVRNIKDRKAKAEIRKAETPAKVLEMVCKMYHASLAEASESATD